MIEPASIPQPLVDAILRGRCIAFVGAGFSRPAVPGWKELLVGIGARVGVDADLPPGASALDYELVGQSLRERAGSDRAFEQHVQAVLEECDHRDDADAVAGRRLVERRVGLLKNIPFKAILTTNFDRWLEGTTARPSTYWNVLRETRGRWWDYPVTASDTRPRVPIIKLHGDANGDPKSSPLVLGRADYRRRIYGENGYASFIRAAFAQYTILFLGVSFTDAYLNELRSETLSVLHDAARPADDAWGYCVMLMDGKPPGFPALFRAHEGIEVLRAERTDQFDEWLTAIEARTSVQGRLRDLLGGKQILWVDARPENNVRGKELFESCGARVIALTDEQQLRPEHATDSHLLVTQFGHDATTGDSRAFRVLEVLRQWPSRPPVIVFASPQSLAHENRLACMRRGAWEYATAWSELYRLVEVLFGRSPGHAKPSR